MKTNDILVRMRASLKDKNPIQFAWSDNDLIDCINLSLTQLSLHDIYIVLELSL